MPGKAGSDMDTRLIAGAVGANNPGRPANRHNNRNCDEL